VQGKTVPQGSDIPDLEKTIRGNRGQAFAVGGEGQAIDFFVMALHLGGNRPGGDIQQKYARTGSEGQMLAAGMKGRAGHGISMLFIMINRIFFIHFPDGHFIALRQCHHMLSVGR
jgi:hypothetical protein